MLTGAIFHFLFLCLVAAICLFILIGSRFRYSSLASIDAPDRAITQFLQLASSHSCLQQLVLEFLNSLVLFLHVASLKRLCLLQKTDLLLIKLGLLC
jgi:glycerol-3-phosphate acyltransferase PlsY